MESAIDGILIARDWRIEFANRAAVRLFGASPTGEILGKSPFNVFHRDSHGVIQERIERLLRGERLPPVEEKIVRLDGGVTDVEVNSTLFADREGGAIQVIGRDITERKRREALLRESEERLSLAFAGAQEGIWDWNLENDAAVYSSRWKEMLGYSDEEIEPHISAWERLVHPADRAGVDQQGQPRMSGVATRNPAKRFVQCFLLSAERGYEAHPPPQDPPPVFSLCLRT